MLKQSQSVPSSPRTVPEPSNGGPLDYQRVERVSHSAASVDKGAAPENTDFWSGDVREWAEREHEVEASHPEGPSSVHFGFYDVPEFNDPEFSDDVEDTLPAWPSKATDTRKFRAPKGYTRSDTRIREDVCDRLGFAPFDPSHVEVDVREGVVHLTGTVAAAELRLEINALVERVAGVRGVENEIGVARPRTLE